jgi:hypothetical protein
VKKRGPTVAGGGTRGLGTHHTPPAPVSTLGGRPGRYTSNEYLFRGCSTTRMDLAANIRSECLSRDTEGGDEVFMQFEPDAVEGIKVCGDEPGRLRGRICQCPLKALCVSAEPR